MQMERRGEARSPIEWEIGVPLATNRRMLGQMALAFGLAAVIAYLLVAIALVAQGEWKALPPLAIAFAAAGGGLYALGLLIMLMVFGNRMNMRFRVDSTALRRSSSIAGRVRSIGSRSSRARSPARRMSLAPDSSPGAARKWRRGGPASGKRCSIHAA